MVMIIVRLWGGLGNQLFQYSYALALSTRLNTELILDVSYYDKNKLRKPSILNFNLENNILTSDLNEVKLIRFYNLKIINKLIRLPAKCRIKMGKFTYYKETRLKYNSYSYDNVTDNSYVDGYWQSEKYFSEIKPVLLRKFYLAIFKDANAYELIDKFSRLESVAIHVRRGDYVSNRRISSRLKPLSVNYYKQAIENAKVALKNPMFYFFTDDPEWVLKNIEEANEDNLVSKILSSSDIEELILMSKCKHQIIANSTFSWWSAWLNKNSGKKIWAPNIGWVNDDIKCDNWILI